MIPAPEALERLVDGNRRFVAEVRSSETLTSNTRRRELTTGQEPFAIILGCSDSRVPAEIVFDQGLGDLFVIRVAGNIVAPSQIGSVEFAAEQFGTPFLILNFHAPQEILRARVTQRLARADDASDADLAVLEQQLDAREPLTPAEMAAAFAVDATAPVARDMWRPFIERLRQSAGGKVAVPGARAAHPDHEKSA